MPAYRCRRGGYRSVNPLTEAEAARVHTVVARAIDSVCTVGRTLKAGTEVTFEIADGRG